MSNKAGLGPVCADISHSVDTNPVIVPSGNACDMYTDLINERNMH